MQHERRPAVQYSSRIVAPTGVPRAPRLVGRAAEQRAIARRLRAGGRVALVAPDGLGKTALAAELFTRHGAEPAAFPGGALWVSCAAMRGEDGPAELWAQIARSLLLEGAAVELRPERARDGVAATLRQRPPMLFVLDDAVTPLVADLLDNTPPGTTLLVTAARPLADDRLFPFPLRPLAPESAGALLKELRGLGDYDTLPADGVARLAGVPLAIRLAAARLARPGVDAAAFLAGYPLPPTLDGLVRRGVQAARDDLAPAAWRCFIGLALAEGASVPRGAALALGSPDDVAALEQAALLAPIPGEARVALHPLLRVLAAEALRALPADEQGALGDALLAFWVHFIGQRRVYATAEAMETDAPGLLGILDWALDHGRDAAAQPLAQAIFPS